MSRFINLELGDEFEGQSGPKQVVRDEAYYLQEAQQAFEQAKFERGLRAYARVLEHNPQNPVAWTGQVKMLIELNELKEANLWAEKALERFPNEPELLAAKAVALGRLQEVDDALAFSDASVQERGDSPYIWLARGDVLLARKEKRAAFCFEKASSQLPQYWFIHWLASRSHFFHRQYAIALKFAQSALNLDPGLFVVWLQVGLCQQELGLNSAAGHSIGRALELNPACEEAERARGNLANTRGWERIRKTVRRILGS